MDCSMIETLLWQVVYEEVEEVSVAKSLLKNIGYFDETKIEKITRCTVLDSEYFDIGCISYNDNKVYVDYEMPFILDVWDGENQRIFNITAFASGKCAIPTENEFDYSAYDFDSMKRDELLSYGNIVDILDISYSDIEVNG